MAVFRSQYALGKKIVQLPPASGLVTVVRGFITLTVAPTTGDKYELFPLPGGFDLVDFLLISDDIDTNGAPAVTMSVGLMSGTPGANDNARTVAAEIISASTIGQAGGTVRASLATAFTLPDSDVTRAIGLKFPVVPATFAAGTTIRWIASIASRA